MTRDDRSEFAQRQAQISRAIGEDQDLRDLDLAATIAADRRDFSYTWRWLGVPIIQMPTDIAVMQEIIWECRPDLIVEAGVARGGSVILSASILELMGAGTVLGIDVDLRPHNRAAIEEHAVAHRIRLIEGSSMATEVVAQVESAAASVENVMVILDSDHTHTHVLAEMTLYSRFVTQGQFLVVADTFVERLPVQDHRPRPWGPGNNPMTAVREFLGTTTRFIPDEYYNSKLLMSSSPGGYLRCLSSDGAS